MPSRSKKSTQSKSVWRLHTRVKKNTVHESIQRLHEKDLNLLELKEPDKVYLFIKRVIDITGSLLGLIILSPILLAVAICIKVLSDGPVFYIEKRIGYKAKPFNFIKFRTMVSNAHILKSNLSFANEMSGPFFKVKEDPRVTDFGRFLRKYSIDELPQLFNVLAGDMTLVGPRPCQISEYECLNKWQKKAKSAMKPGITCIWQVSGRNLISNHDEWMKLDIEYVQKASLWTDIKLLLKTAPAVLSGIGAS